MHIFGRAIVLLILLTMPAVSVAYVFLDQFGVAEMPPARNAGGGAAQSKTSVGFVTFDSDGPAPAKPGYTDLKGPQLSVIGAAETTMPSKPGPYAKKPNVPTYLKPSPFNGSVEVYDMTAQSKVAQIGYAAPPSPLALPPFRPVFDKEPAAHPIFAKAPLAPLPMLTAVPAFVGAGENEPKQARTVPTVETPNSGLVPLVPLTDKRPAPVALFNQPPAPVQIVQPKEPPVEGKPVDLPAPRPLTPFGPKQVRMSLLGDSEAAPLGKTPYPSAKDLEEQAKYIDRFIDPYNTIDLIEGRTRLMMMKDTPKRLQVSDEKIVSYTLIGDKDISLLGKRPGNTVLNFWFTSADDKTKEKVLSYLVRVFPDPEAKERLERVYKALELEINKAFPNSVIRLQLVGDKVLVTGQAHDIQDATQILKMVVANTPGATRIPTEALANTARPEQPNAPGGATPGQENYVSSGSPNVVNMMRVGGVHQVMLRVVVAEVNRSAARSIGLNFSLTNKQGRTYFQNLTGGLSAASTLIGGTSPLGNLPVLLDNGQVSLSINALKKLSYAKSLAEPNLVTLNGQPASFLAGGQFPVPVVTGTQGGGGLQGVQFVPFGVQLQFTPFITDKDRIRLSVSATVSTRDISTGTNVGNSNVPGLNSRNFTSTVEMRDGQTLAVAGLIQSNSGADRDNLPFLGDIPFLNRFTGFDRTSAGEQELVVLITPEIVNPMHAHQIPRLPGSDLFEPSDLEFYLLGRLEGRRIADFRSPVMNDFHRINQYNHCEKTYIFGPVGYIPLNPR